MGAVPGWFGADVTDLDSLSVSSSTSEGAWFIILGSQYGLHAVAVMFTFSIT